MFSYQARDRDREREEEPEGWQENVSSFRATVKFFHYSRSDGWWWSFCGRNSHVGGLRYGQQCSLFVRMKGNIPQEPEKSQSLDTNDAN